MRISSLSYLFLLSATACLSKPLENRKRYDLDGNGVPDWCYTDAACTAYCLQSNSQWVAVSATSCTISSSSTLALTSSIVPVITTSAAAKMTSYVISSSSSTEAAITSSSSTVQTGVLPAPSQFATDKARNGLSIISATFNSPKNSKPKGWAETNVAPARSATKSSGIAATWNAMVVGRHVASRWVRLSTAPTM